VLGMVIGAGVMRVIDNGINMFQYHYVDVDKVPRIWRLDQNWTFIIIGGVILVAVILDQSVHLVQQMRRIKAAGALAEAKATPLAASHVTNTGASPPPNP